MNLKQVTNTSLEHVPAMLNSHGAASALAAFSIVPKDRYAFRLGFEPHKVSEAWHRAWNDKVSTELLQNALAVTQVSTDLSAPDLHVLIADMAFAESRCAFHKVAAALCDGLLDPDGRLKGDEFGRSTRQFAGSEARKGLFALCGNKHRWIDLPNPQLTHMTENEWSAPMVVIVNETVIVFQRDTQLIYGTSIQHVRNHTLENSPMGWQKLTDLKSTMFLVSEPWRDGTFLIGTRSPINAAVSSFSLQAHRLYRKGHRASLCAHGKKVKVTAPWVPSAIGPSGVTIVDGDGYRHLLPSALPPEMQVLYKDIHKHTL